MMYLELFWAYLKIGLFSIGGGRAALPIVQGIVVDEKGWLDYSQFSDVIAISEMTPGPFGINSATFIGVKLGGVLGGLTATFASMLAPFLIVMLLAFLFNRFGKLTVVKGALIGVRPAVTGLLSAAAVSILCMALFGVSYPTGTVEVDSVAFVVCVMSYVLLKRFKLNSVLVIFIAGFLGLALYSL